MAYLNYRFDYDHLYHPDHIKRIGDFFVPV